MTNPGGDSNETPASDAGSGSSEPSSGGYEAPPIEQSLGDQPTQMAPQVDPSQFPAQQPTEQFVPPGQPFAPPDGDPITPPGGFAPPSTGYDVPPSYQPQPPVDYSQGGYPPPTYPAPPAYPTPPSYPPPSAQQSYPPYPDPSAFGPPPGYGAPAYPPPPPQFGGPPGYPPPPSAYPPPSGYPGAYQGYGQPQSETNQLAIWSLVASLIGILCTIGSIAGIAMGVIALNQIKQSRQGGHGLAVAGIAVGIATLIVSIIWTAFAFST
jgi:hypothetical protein